jgi:predicted acyltransferase
MRYVEVQPALQTRRVESVDVLRGFNFVWILGGDMLMWAIAEMSKGKGSLVAAAGGFLGGQLTHVAWDGFRFYDLIFPLFVFLTGVSIVLSLPRLVEREGRARAQMRILRRALILYGLGLVYYGGLSHYYEGLGGHWSDIRVLGVLQRISLCYLAASLMFLNFSLRGLIAAFVGLLVGYWALMTFVPVPGIGAGSFAPDANLANWIDAHYLPGRLWDVTRDPEGILSTLPAIASCLLGVFAGLLLRDVRVPAQTKSLWLIGAGIVLLAAGYVWALQFPIIKAIWTSSFVLVAGGWSAILLGAVHQVVDVWGLKRWATAFTWIGTNAIALYMINNLVGLDKVAARFVDGDLAKLLDRAVTPGAGAFLTAALTVTFAVALARYLHRHKIFIRV